jgi:hypothetical protein
MADIVLRHRKEARMPSMLELTWPEAALAALNKKRVSNVS